jgi:hypothetical protein
VDVTGPCSSKPDNGSEPQVFFISVLEEGVCHVTVSFRSGAPDFVSDVQLAKPKGSGCCLTLAYAQDDVIVPELGPMDASAEDSD